jgi:hypothetical protein
MSNRVAIVTITDMLATNLELGYEAIGAGKYAMARHEFNEALEKLSQIESLAAQEAGVNAATQTLLIEVGASVSGSGSGIQNQESSIQNPAFPPTHEQGPTRTDPKVRRRKT